MKFLRYLLLLTLLFATEVYGEQKSYSDNQNTVDGVLDMTSTNSQIVIECNGMSTFTFAPLRTTETGTVQVSGSSDQTNWMVIPVTQQNVNPQLWVSAGNTTNLGSIAIGNGHNLYFANCAGYRFIRVKVSTGGTGTALPVRLTTSRGQVVSVIEGLYPGTTADSLGKAEDAAHASGDVGILQLGVRNDSGAALSGTDLDYTPIATNSRGAVFGDIQSGLSANIATSILKLEDAAHASGDAGVQALTVRSDAFTTAPASASGDYQPPWTDRWGRTLSIIAPHEITTKSCSTTATTTANTQIVPNQGAGVRVYVTSVGCSNTSAVASEIQLKDSTTAIWYGGIGTQAATGGDYQKEFNPPLKISANAPFQFAMTTTATSTTCCALYYVATD